MGSDPILGRRDSSGGSTVGDRMAGLYWFISYYYLGKEIIICSKLQLLVHVFQLDEAALCRVVGFQKVLGWGLKVLFQQGIDNLCFFFGWGLYGLRGKLRCRMSDRRFRGALGSATTSCVTSLHLRLQISWLFVPLKDSERLMLPNILDTPVQKFPTVTTLFLIKH